MRKLMVLVAGLAIQAGAQAVMTPSPAELDRVLEVCEGMLVQQAGVTADQFNPSSQYYPSVELGDNLDEQAELAITIRYEGIIDVYCKGKLDGKGFVKVDESLYQNGDIYKGK